MRYPSPTVSALSPLLRSMPNFGRRTLQELVRIIARGLDLMRYGRGCTIYGRSFLMKSWGISPGPIAAYWRVKDSVRWNPQNDSRLTGLA